MAKPTPQSWQEVFGDEAVVWRSERGARQPAMVLPVDDTMTADQAYRLACEGVGLLWQGDYHNARQLLTAMAKRLDKAHAKPPKASKGESANSAELTITQAFHKHRQTQAQRANVLNRLLISVRPDGSIPLKRAPVAVDALVQAWGDCFHGEGGRYIVALREFLGIVGSFQWHINGVDIAALGAKIYPTYGVFSPVRGEYIDLVNTAPLPQPCEVAWDIGTGTGVLMAVLAKRGVTRVVGTENDPRAVFCARANLSQLPIKATVEVLEHNLFPAGKADLIVCNPPWLPTKPSAPIERAVYDEGAAMLLAFLGDLASHLTPTGQGWLIMSDLAELLGLRERGWLEQTIQSAGLRVLAVHTAKPKHGKSANPADPLYQARSAETTCLWRLTHA